MLDSTSRSTRSLLYELTYQRCAQNLLQIIKSLCQQFQRQKEILFVSIFPLYIHWLILINASNCRDGFVNWIIIQYEALYMNATFWGQNKLFHDRSFASVFLKPQDASRRTSNEGQMKRQELFTSCSLRLGLMLLAWCHVFSYIWEHLDKETISKSCH